MDDDALTNHPPAAPPPTKVLPAAAPELPEVAIPDHQLLRRIGRGSYGEVWLARSSLGLFRAVKIVYRESFKELRPFEREWSGIRKFEPISRSHEGFVDVLHVGINEAQGYFFYVMELGDDLESGQAIDPAQYFPKTLGQAIKREGRLPFAECLKLGLALSQALAELHKNSLVHRDIKPSNIIFVHGVPKLADIGLVAGLDDEPSFVGTEGFIPPEGPGKPPADVYGLGKVLYECATGMDRQKFPELPARFDEFPDREAFLELNEVILNACKNEPSSRYASAWDMHAHLLVLANGKSVRRLRQLERRVARFRRGLAVALVAFGVAVALGYPSWREWRLSLEMRQRQVGENVTEGVRAMESGDLAGALPFFAEALRLDQGDPARELPQRLRFGAALSQSPRLVQTWSEFGSLTSINFSPDGRTVLTTAWNGSARLRDAATGQSRSPEIDIAGVFRRGAFSPDGKFIVAACADRLARLWRVDDGRLMAKFQHPAEVLSAQFSPDGTRLVTGCVGGLTRVWDVAAGKVQIEISNQNNSINFAAFSPDGSRLVTAGEDKTARLWSAADGRSLGTPLEHLGRVTHAAFSPDGQLLVTAGADRRACVWEVETGRRIMPDMHHDDLVASAQFSPDGRLIATAGADGSIRLWLAETHQPFMSGSVLRQGDRVVQAAFSPDGHCLAAAGAEGTVRIWDLAGAPDPLVQLPGAVSGDASVWLTRDERGLQAHSLVSDRPLAPRFQSEFPTDQAKLNANGSFALTISVPIGTNGDSRRAVEVWKTATGTRVAPPLFLDGAETTLDLDPNGQTLLKVAGTNAWTWNVLTGAARSALVPHPRKIGWAGFSPDGKWVVSRSVRVVKVWSADTGLDRFPALTFEKPVAFVTFSPDGRRLATCLSDRYDSKCSAQIWDAATGQSVGMPLGHGRSVRAAAFSPDGGRVVTASEDHTAIEWDAATGRQLLPAFRHEAAVGAAAFSPDGRWIVTDCVNGLARVWGAESGQPLTPPQPHSSPASRVWFLADGRSVLLAGGMEAAWKWRLPVDARPTEEISQLARLLTGDLVKPAAYDQDATPEPLLKIWPRLRLARPEAFAVSASAGVAWHERQVAESETENHWMAVVFHLEQLAALRPGDATIAEHLRAARERAKNQGLLSPVKSAGLSAP